MNVVVYGKTMENLRNRVDVRLVNRKRLFEMAIKITLLNIKNISQPFGSDSKNQTTLPAYYLNVSIRIKQSTNV